jgi:hypothetical protein
MISKKSSMEISHSMYASVPIPSYVGGYEEPVIVRRQQKTTQKYYPINYRLLGGGGGKQYLKRLTTILQMFLPKPNRAAQSVVELGCNSCKANMC